MPAKEAKAPDTVDNKGVEPGPSEGRVACPKGGEADPGWCADGCDPFDTADCPNNPDKVPDA